MAAGRRRPGGDRFLQRSTLRTLGAIEYVACRTRSGRPTLLVGARPDIAAAESGALLSEIARVHRLLDVPGVPKVAAIDEGSPPSFVALDCDGVLDLETMTVAAIADRDEHLARGSTPAFTVDFAGASAHALAVFEQLARAHATVDPRTGGPICLGPVSAANFLVSEEGRVWTLGWGHPWRGDERSRLLAELPGAFAAPEAAFGLATTPGSDLAATCLYFHGFQRLGKMPAALTACLAGEAVPPELREGVTRLMTNAHGPRPEDRSLSQFLSDFRSTLALLDIVPSDAAFTETLRAGVRLVRSRAARGLVVAVDARWCLPPGGPPLSLERRGALRKLVLSLAIARRDAPGEALSWESLLAAGWPGESPAVLAGKNRVYVAVAQLRTLGLRDVLLRHDDGYLFDPRQPLVWSDAPPPSDER